MADDTSQQGGTAGATQPRVPEEVAKKYPDLETLITGTESMTPEEREYWFQILPIMTDEQIQKLRGILLHEKDQLAKLDSEYESELLKLNDKHLLEWKEHEVKEKRDKRAAEEAAHEAAEKAAEEDILKQLEDDTK